MPFKRFVETGRVALIANGPFSGRLVAIVDVIDQTRALIDGPTSKVPRQAIRLNQLRLTKYRLKFPFTASTKLVRRVWIKDEIDKSWKESAWAKNAAAKRLRRTMTDLDRFKLKHAKRVRNSIRTIAYNKLLSGDRKLREKSRKENKGKKGYGRKQKAKK